MRKHRLVVPFLSLTLACASYACSGDDDGALPGENDGGADAAHDSGKDAHADAHVNVDSGQPDTSTPIEDTGTPDTTVADTSVPDTSVPDTSVPDTSVTDTGTHDTGVDASDGGTVVDASDGSTTTDASDGAIADASDGATTIDASDGAIADASDGATTIDASDAGPAIVPSVYVLRLGDGSGALSGTSTAGFLDHVRVTDGVILGTVALPTAANGANQPISFSGTATSEGALSLSSDGHHVAFAGYAAAPGTASISSSLSFTTDGGTFYRRVVGAVNASGVVDTSTQLEGAFSGNSVRSATTADGTAFWVSGNGSSTSGGVHYVALGATSTSSQIESAVINARWLNIFAGQLYATSASGAFIGVNIVGTGLPTTSGQTVTNELLATGTSPYGFIGLDLSAVVAGIDTYYVSDDRGLSDAGALQGGIQKWTLAAGIWTATPVYNTGLTGGVRGVATFVTAGVVTLVATTTDNKVVTAVDDGITAPVFTTIATAATNTVFRGVAPVPN